MRLIDAYSAAARTLGLKATNRLGWGFNGYQPSMQRNCNNRAYQDTEPFRLLFELYLSYLPPLLPPRSSFFDRFGGKFDLKDAEGCLDLSAFRPGVSSCLRGVLLEVVCDCGLASFRLWASLVPFTLSLK
jgi:hypothetical protein